MSLIRTLVVCTIFASSSLAIASGGGGYGRGGSFGGSGIEPRPVDHTYEYGKSVFQGRVKGVNKTAYCIDNGTEKVKLKSKSIKPFKGGSISGLASKLYDCNNPSTLIASTLSRRDMQYVMYYLNKRYKLKLK